MGNNDLVHIYNIYQKRFYLQNGARMLDAQLNKNTNKVCWIFSKQETKELFNEWVKLSERRVSPSKRYSNMTEEKLHQKDTYITF